MLEVQQQQTLNSTEIWVHLKRYFCFTKVCFLIVMLAHCWPYMLHNTAPVTYTSRTQSHNMALVWTVKNLLGKNAEKDTRREAPHTPPASYATSVSTGMRQCAIKRRWHSTKRFHTVFHQQHFLFAL